jgi:hypothetical protein
MRHSARIGIAGVVAVAIAGAAGWALGAGGDNTDRTAVPAGGCDARVSRGPIPAWARGGFSEPEPRLPHAISRGGKLAALLLGDPLSSPPAPDHSNKILWVSRIPTRSPSDLRIRARRYAAASPAGPAVTRVVPRGPGPSVIDLPAPGCWRLRLKWSGHADTLDLGYRRPSE